MSITKRLSAALAVGLTALVLTGCRATPTTIDPAGAPPGAATSSAPASVPAVAGTSSPSAGAVAAAVPAPAATIAAPTTAAARKAAPAAPKTGAPAGGTGSCPGNEYRNSSGHCVQRPTAAAAPPAGASAQCNDGTYSFSEHRRGTCSGHHGVKVWLKDLPA